MIIAVPASRVRGPTSTCCLGLKLQSRPDCSFSLPTHIQPALQPTHRLSQVVPKSALLPVGIASILVQVSMLSKPVTATADPVSLPPVLPSNPSNPFSTPAATVIMGKCKPDHRHAGLKA